MKRRTLLSAVGAGVAGLAGCSGALEELEQTEDGETPRPTGRLPGRPGNDTASCSSLSDEYSYESVPVRNLPELGGQYPNLGCPTFEWAERTICYHTADLDTTAVVLLSDSDRVFVGENSGATVTFALANRSGDEVETHPGTWTVLQPTDDGDDWSLVASGGPSCTRTIGPEGVHWWHLGVRERPTSDFIDVTTGTADIAPGTYVFAAPAFLPSGDHVMCVAPFEIIDIDDTEIGDTPTPVPDAPSAGTPR